MADPEQSIQLLSTMSPKIAGNQRFRRIKPRKAPTRLALRKSIRRSAAFDKLPHLPAPKVLDVDSSSESSLELKPVRIEQPVIIILDSSGSDGETNVPDIPTEHNHILSASKFNVIKNWVTEVDGTAQKENPNSSAFSCVSSIQGDAARQGNANSSFMPNRQIKFDELFLKRKEDRKKHKLIDDIEKALDKDDDFADKVAAICKGLQLNHLQKSDSDRDSDIINDTLDEKENMFTFNEIRNKTVKGDVLSELNFNNKINRNLDLLTPKLNTDVKLAKTENKSDKNFSRKLSSDFTATKKDLGESSDKDLPNNVVNSSNDSIGVRAFDSNEATPVKQVMDRKNDSSVNINTTKRRNRRKSTEKTDDLNRNEQNSPFFPGITKVRSRRIDDSESDEDPFDALKNGVYDAENLLDELYGNQWRKDRKHVLPKSEPRIPKKPNYYRSPKAPKTERKPKKSLLYKNPYLDTPLVGGRLLRTIQTSNLPQTSETPWRSRLQSLCDSDTDSSTERPIPHRLNFNEPENRVEFSGDDSSSSRCSANSSKKDEKSGTNKAFKKPSTPQSKVTPSKKQLQSESLESITNKIRTDLKIRDLSEERMPKEISTRLKRYFGHSANSTLSFLASLSKDVPDDKCNQSARIFKNNYGRLRDELRVKLFDLYNEKIFDNAIPKDVSFEWSVRMTDTAGYCACRKVTHRSGVIDRTVRFVLSTKVLSSADRLRDTLVHEMCHAACWLVDGVADGHGHLFKKWARKVAMVFPDLPAVSTRHNYKVETKYTYKCSQCNYSFGRHQKSLNIEKKVCGKCYGKFEVFTNKTDKNGQIKSVATPKKAPTGFALYVQENYASYRKSCDNHQDVMKLLGQKYKQLKSGGD